MIGSTMTST